MAVRRMSNQKIFIDDIEIEAVQVTTHTSAPEYHIDYDTPFASRSTGSIEILLKSGGTLEAPLQYIEVVGNDLYCYGIFQPIKRIETQWKLAYLVTQQLDASKYHELSHIFRTDKARGFELGYLSRQAEVHKLTNEAESLSGQVKDLESEIRNLENTVESLSDELRERDDY